mmetsp:Transcript_4917/g.2741  ORF Transcript_4917/g.2741 Transcript_4917/m.2741 type:complete len:123 (+) Transcript_4917:8133-8501(+)
MTFVLLISPTKTSLFNLAATLEDNNIYVAWAESGSIAFSMISEKTFDLVITDESLGDMTSLEFAKKLVTVNPMINCAVVSSLSSEDFHEASEGLGILMQLPPQPDKIHTENLLQHLNNILNI